MAWVWGLERVLTVRPQPASDQVRRNRSVAATCVAAPPTSAMRRPALRASTPPHPEWLRRADRADRACGRAPTIGIATRVVVPCRSRIPDAQARRMPAETAPAPIDAHRDVLGNDAAGLDPGRARLGIEAAIGAGLRRNTRLRGHHITVTAGAEGLVTLTGAVPTQALRRRAGLSCWTGPGVWTLHDDLAVGRSAVARNTS
jgi:BON domain-containing protein